MDLNIFNAFQYVVVFIPSDAQIAAICARGEVLPLSPGSFCPTPLVSSVPCLTVPYFLV